MFRYVITLVALTLNLWPGTLAQEFSTKTYKLPDNSSVKLDAPKDWKDSFTISGHAVVIAFTPNDSRNFKLQLTAIPISNLQPDSNKPDQLKSVIQQMGQSMMRAAEEEKLEVTEMKLNKGTGYYFMLTDKTAKLGQRKYLRQGIVGIEGIQLFFMFTSNEKDSKEERQALEIVKTIQAIKSNGT